MKKSMTVLSFLLVLALVFSVPASAHTPIFYVEDYHDGTVYMQGGFSDGSSAAGTVIMVVEDKEFSGDTSSRDAYLEKIGAEIPEGDPALFEGKLIIYKTKLDDFSELNLDKPDCPYLLVFDAGPGHKVIEKGPKLTDSEK